MITSQEKNQTGKCRMSLCLSDMTKAGFTEGEIVHHNSKLMLLTTVHQRKPGSSKTALGSTSDHRVASRLPLTRRAAEVPPARPAPGDPAGGSSWLGHWRRPQWRGAPPRLPLGPWRGRAVAAWAPGPLHSAARRSPRRRDAASPGCCWPAWTSENGDGMRRRRFAATLGCGFAGLRRRGQGAARALEAVFNGGREMGLSPKFGVPHAL